MVLSPLAFRLRRMDDPLSLQHLSSAARQLRVAVVTETYPPEVNGVAMTTGRLVDGLLALGHRVQLIRPRQGAEDRAAVGESFEEVLARGLPIPRYNHLRMGLPARSALTRMWSLRRPDVVQVVTEGPLGWSAVAAARKLRLPVVTEFHTNFHTYSRYYGIGWLKQPVAAYLRRFHNKGCLCLAPTPTLAEELRAGGIRRVEVVARGVDTGLFTPARRDEALRRSWGARPDTLVLAVVGRVAPEKNLGLALRAYAALRVRQPDVRLLIVGDGPSRAELARAEPDAIFAGMRSGADLAAHYASADLFLFPSLTETFGNVTTEALASGLPVVGFDYAAAGERVRNGVNGWLAAPEDEGAFIAAVCRLGLDRHACQEMARAARASVMDADWAAVSGRLASLLEGEVEAHEGRTAAGGRVATA